MSLRFRHYFKLGNRTGIVWNIPLSSGGKRAQGGVGCLALMVGGVAVIFQTITGGGKSAPTSRDYESHVSEKPLEMIGHTLPPKSESILAIAPAQAAPEHPKTAVAAVSLNSLQRVSARALFDSIQLGKKGFIFSDHSQNTLPFWIYRKTDSDREYTAAILGADKGVAAVTAELVNTKGSLADYAKTYFLAITDQLTPPEYRDAARVWVANVISSESTQTFGDLIVTISHLSGQHHRMTIVLKN